MRQLCPPLSFWSHRDGALCYSVPGNGRYIARDALESLKSAASNRLNEFSALAASLRSAGVPKSALYDAIETVYAFQKEKEAEV